MNWNQKSCVFIENIFRYQMYYNQIISEIIKYLCKYL